MDFSRPTRLATTTNLKKAWLASRDSRGQPRSAGIDGETPAQFARRIDESIQRARSRLFAPTFAYHSLRASFIPKKNGGERVISIPTVEDRLIQRVCLAHLQSGDKLKVRNRVSYGFHSGKDTGVRWAVDRAKNLRTQHPWAVKSDIESFFNRIQRSPLKDALKRALGKRAVVPFLLAAIDTEVKVDDDIDAKRLAASDIKSGEGLRQGMPLSPLLSNFVLRSFDLGIIAGNLRMVRYADDLIVFCDSKDEALRALEHISVLLEKLGPTIPPLGNGSKTQIYEPDVSAEFLGFDIAPLGKRYRVLAPKIAWDRAVELSKQFQSFDECRRRSPTLAGALNSLRSKLTSFASTYSIAKNSSQLTYHAENCRRQAAQNLLTSIFGSDVVSKLSAEKLAFLDIELGKVI